MTDQKSNEGARVQSGISGKTRVEYGFDRIIINDGRTLIAKTSTGETLVKIAKDGVTDVATAPPEDLMFDSSSGAGGIISDVGNTVGGWTVNDGELVGTGSALIRSGQTSFNNGVGFFLGNVDVPQFSIGNSQGDNIIWDGVTLRITGNFVLSSLFNNVNYTVADLPTPPATEGFNSPAGNE